MSARPAWLRHALAAAAVAASLWVVMLVHATGQTLLALVLLVGCALAVWTYTSRRTHALRYLFPGVAAALVFVVFPMLYTVGIGFTNHSSTNLLDEARARQLLLDESVTVPGTQRPFVVLPAEGSRVRLQLPAHEARPALITPPFELPQPTAADPGAQGSSSAGAPVALQSEQAPSAAPIESSPWTMRQTVEHLPSLRQLTLTTPEGARLTLASLREFAQQQSLYAAQQDGSLVDRLTGTAYRIDRAEGFYASAEGDRLQPGFRVGVGLRHYEQVFSDGKFREPFLSVFVWTVAFSGLTVLGAAALGLLLASLLHWEALRFRGAYRMVLFLPYAVPGFISILVFKGLFNQNLGEVNLILHGLFGIKPAWFSDPALARLMLLIVNIWLGFPYMMVLCSGLIQSIPADLYEASAVVGAGPWTNFTRITLPLIAKPLTPLLISAFAFNFNNFVLVSLLTGGRPDLTDSTLPAGTTDLLVSYTWRIAFQDSGQQFGLAAAISTVIFLIVAAITLVQMKLTQKEAVR